jgi:hypothetical protein
VVLVAVVVSPCGSAERQDRSVSSKNLGGDRLFEMAPKARRKE